MDDDDINHEEINAVVCDNGEATDAARRTSQRLTEPMRPCAGATTDGGLDSPDEIASVKPLPFGDRAVVFE